MTPPAPPAHSGFWLHHGDLNDVDADVVVVPIEASLRPARLVAQSLVRACSPEVAASLARLQTVFAVGVDVGTVFALPALGHKRAHVAVFVVVFDDCAGPLAVLEPDEARVERATASLARLLQHHDAGDVAVVPFAGRSLDTGEVAATMARALAAEAARRRVFFAEKDRVLAQDIRAAITSIDVVVHGAVFT
jgi:hypothetical protein